MSNEPPVIIDAPESPASSSATIIFLHGLGDDAHGWTDLVSQIHAAKKLPHVKWILPNAPPNRDAMAQAWYMPKPFSPIPMPKRSGEPDPEEDDEDDDEEGMMKSVDYICGLIDKEVEGGVPVGRICLGGFSQGCAITLLIGLMSRYKGRLGGLVGLSGYMPLSGQISKSVGNSKEEHNTTTRWFLAHGTRDQLVPRQMFTSYSDKLKDWEGEGVEVHMYEGMGHSTTGAEIRDLCNWLEGVLSMT